MEKQQESDCGGASGGITMEMWRLWFWTENNTNVVIEVVLEGKQRKCAGKWTLCLVIEEASFPRPLSYAQFGRQELVNWYWNNFFSAMDNESGRE